MIFFIVMNEFNYEAQLFMTYMFVILIEFFMLILNIMRLFIEVMNPIISSRYYDSLTFIFIPHVWLIYFDVKLVLTNIAIL